MLIRLAFDQWQRLHDRLKQEYSNEPSVLLVRAKQRQVLGFTSRLHRHWVTDTHEWQQVVYLDFYDEVLLTFFRLKYAEYL